MLSDYHLEIVDHYNIPIGNAKKLVPNFFDKEKYVIHYENLKLYLRLGIKLKKIHCVLEFNQSQWLKKYVDFNTPKRIEPEKNGDKDGKALYKLMNNSVYGKTIENLRHRIDVRLVSNKKDYPKWTSKSKPKYLELIKDFMCEFHYDYIKNKYGNNLRLLFTDIDNLMFEIKTEDVYEDFSNNKKCLTLVIIQLSQNIMIIQTNS